MRKGIWFIGISLMVLISCKWQSKQSDSKIDKAFSDGDTLNTLILDTIESKYITKSKPLWTPTNAQIDQIDSILIKAIKDTLEITNNEFEIKDINGYYKQYVCYVDNSGDLIVFINAFCHLHYAPVDSADKVIWKTFDWKNKILFVNDGGACYWYIRINLTQKKYFDFSVNGLA